MVVWAGPARKWNPTEALTPRSAVLAEKLSHGLLSADDAAARSTETPSARLAPERPTSRRPSTPSRTGPCRPPACWPAPTGRGRTAHCCHRRVAAGAQAQVIAANGKDLEAGRSQRHVAALLDRLTPGRAPASTAWPPPCDNLAGLPDPVGTVERGQTLPNGLRLRQVHVPMGVVAAIYEARPNVTVDIAGLALKSGNAVILRGGTAAADTNAALIGMIRDALDPVGLPADAVQTVDEYGREGASVLMQARGRVDVLIPRGGHDLIQTVVTNAKVPVIETGEGNVHIFLDKSASEQMAVDILLNAKTQRPSVCNTVETLLVHSEGPRRPRRAAALAAAGVRLHVDNRVAALLPGTRRSQTMPATDEDWGREYMDLDLAVAMVDSMDEAIEHIREVDHRPHRGDHYQ